MTIISDLAAWNSIRLALCALVPEKQWRSLHVHLRSSCSLSCWLSIRFWEYVANLQVLVLISRGKHVCDDSQLRRHQLDANGQLCWHLQHPMLSATKQGKGWHTKLEPSVLCIYHSEYAQAQQKCSCSVHIHNYTVIVLAV